MTMMTTTLSETYLWDKQISHRIKECRQHETKGVGELWWKQDDVQNIDSPTTAMMMVRLFVGVGLTKKNRLKPLSRIGRMN